MTEATEERARRERWSPYSILAALHFLTTIPPLSRRPFTLAEYGQGVGAFPLVGGVVGLALAAIAWLLANLFPPAVVAALLLVAWILLTGGLHLDGLMDSCDGLLGGHTPEARLRIMRDEQVGAFAATGAILLLLTKYSALSALPQVAAPLVVAATAGRWAMALAVVAYPYARAEGLGSAMKRSAGRRELLLATVLALAVTGIAAGGQGLLALLTVTLLTIAVARFALARIPGLTGDLYGALCEGAETLVLLCFVLRLP